MSKWNHKRKESIWKVIDKPIFIFCGGEQTEPNYFESFKTIIENNAIYRNVVKIEIFKEPLDTIRILNKAIEYVKTNDILKGDVWCVFDKDDFPAQDFNNAILKASSLNVPNSLINYQIAWSNECIELWFLLHFCYYTVNNGRKDYIHKLNEYFAGTKIRKYEKNDKTVFNTLLSLGNPKNAIVNANKLLSLHKDKMPASSVPCTTVHKLVESLAVYLPDDIKSRFIN